MFSSVLRQALKGVGLEMAARDFLRERRFRARMRQVETEWTVRGRPVPPPDSVKHAVILGMAKRYQAQTLVETGTFYGDTIFALRNAFREIHSIELAPELFAHNQRALGHLTQIYLHQGDSASVLPGLLPRLPGPVVFWLDGHFCAGPSARGRGDTPISEELGAIFARPPAADVVLIDDARLFDGTNDYPPLERLRTYCRIQRPKSEFAVQDDIIRVAPV